jgi:hypothetical protein
MEQGKTLRDYVRGTLPRPPKQFHNAERVDGFLDLANSPMATVVYVLQLAYAEIGETFIIPNYAQAFCNASGHLRITPHATILDTWMQDGLFGTRITAYIPVNTKDDEEIAAACYMFGAVYLQAGLPYVLEKLHASEVFTLAPCPLPKIESQCMAISGANREGPSLVLNGIEARATWDFLDYYGEEAYAVIPEALVEADHPALYRLDFDALERDLHS